MTPELGAVRALAVSLQGRRIGVITRLAGDQQLFAFEQEYVDDPARATLSLSFKGPEGALVTRLRPYTTRVPPFFSNLLPEGHLRTYLARLVGIQPQREFFLLAALGADLPGAVVVTPIGDAGEATDRIAAAPHAAEAREARAPLLRFSLAGVQLKFSAILEAAGGLTIPADGIGGAWIIKLPSARFPSVPENEYVMLALARSIGIEVPPNRLVPTKDVGGLPSDAERLGGQALALQRFDRGPDGRRIHMEDFAQVFGIFPDDKYEGRSYANLASVLWAETGEAGTYSFLRRLVFSVLIGNGDMHLKNWSLLYPDGRAPALSPAYDFVSTVPYLPNDRLGLGFGGTRSLVGITRDQIRRFSDKARLPANPLWEIVQETVDRTVNAWSQLPERELLTPDLRSAINSQIEAAASGTDR